MKIPNLIEINKYVYGTYSAMALMNIQTVLNHIKKMADVEGDFAPDCEDYWYHPVMNHIYAAYKDDKYPEKTRLIIEKLITSFPFLKILAENQRDYKNKKNNERRLEINSNDVWYVLNMTFRVLKKYRDYTCHYSAKDQSWEDDSDFLTKNEQPLSYALNKYYDVALRNVKEKYNYDTKQLAFLQDHRYKKTMVNGRRMTVTDYDFYLSIQSINGDKNSKPHLSETGVALLVCLLLEKKYIKSFLDKIHLCDLKQSEEYKILYRSMSINSVVLPRERIRSDKGGMATALDMLNELKRCPRDLFDTMAFEDQSRFRIISADHNEVLQMRHSDRFAQLSLQYIDNNRLFEKIRFHVNMGKLRYLFAQEKQCIDGQTRVRVLEHRLNGYGRLEEMEQQRKNADGTFLNTGIKIRDFENVKRDDANADNYPYIVDTYTHYMLENNKIEMHFGDKMPEIENENGKWYVANVVPTCRMSALELPAMMFHMHLKGSKQTEKRIRKVYDNYVRLFSALCEGKLTKDNIESFGIAPNDMPKKVLDAVNGVTTGKNVNEHIRKTIKELLEETERLIERLKADKRAVLSADNKMGKRNFKQIMPGKLADFLAKDIVRFQPSQLKGDDYGTDKLTGMNYRVMQASIATYSSYDEADAFDGLRKMFADAGLVDGDRKKNHPFLYLALAKRPQNAVELYEHYLKARKRYLEGLMKDIDEGGRVSLPFVNRSNNKWLKRNSDYYRLLGEIYLGDVAIELPRQMFDEDIKEHLKKMAQMDGVDFENANVTYLIGEYMKRVREDDFQDFYSWKRNYRYMDMLVCGIDKKKNSLCKQFTTTAEREQLWKERDEKWTGYSKWALQKKQTDRNMQRLSDADFEEILAKRMSGCRNDYQKSEKMIRRYRVQDALLFLMAESMITEHVDFKGKKFKLKDIMPDADKGVLSEIMPMDFVFEKGGKKYTIHSKGMKIKNYGDFFSLAHDKRFVPLLNILSEVAIEKEEVEDEFNNYDTCRPAVVRLVFDFEKLAFEKYPELQQRVDSGDRIDFSAILTLLKSNEYLSERDSEVLSQIRNAFEHNAYPKRKEVVKIKTLPEIARHLVELFDQHAKKME